jgi:hypothetical protein
MLNVEVREQTWSSSHSNVRICKKQRHGETDGNNEDWSTILKSDQAFRGTTEH